MSELDRVGIVGAGAFGTALALAAHRAGRHVVLWARRAEQATEMRRTGENAAYLPGARLPPQIELTAERKDLRECGLVLLCAPAQATRSVAVALAGDIAPGAPVLACAKGIEQESGLSQTAVIGACLPHAVPAVLSGPGFAEEIAAGLPAAVTIAAADLALAHRLCAALSSGGFRPYASDDMAGVEIGGALKNVLAIAAGVVAGRRLGESARAALITRGLAEMARLGTALGGRAETFAGLAGMGDLVLTAMSPTSRNTAFGIALGEGRSAAELMRPGSPLAEGAHTAPVAADLARRHGIDAPIIAAVASLMRGEYDVTEAIERLVNRPLRAEAG